MQGVYRWILGICLALLNAVLSSSGLTLQRLSALKDVEAKQQPNENHKWSCSPVWIVGVVLYVSAAAPDVVAYVLIPQVVCTAVACFRVALVAVMACACLGEFVQLQQVFGMAICSTGTFLCLTFGPKGQEAESASASEFYHENVVMYLIVGIATLLFLLAVEHADDIKVGCGMSERLRCLTLPLCTGLAYGLEKCFNTEIGFVKSPKNPFHHSRWLGMASAIALLGLTDFYLNLRGARTMKVQVFVPVAFAWGTVVQYFQSIFIFEELQGMSILHVALSTTGACLSLIGALCIETPSNDKYDKIPLTQRRALDPETGVE